MSKGLGFLILSDAPGWRVDGRPVPEPAKRRSLWRHPQRLLRRGGRHRTS